MKSLLPICLGIVLASCSSLDPKTRGPAEVAPASCNEMAKSIFLSDNYEKDLQKVLEERKLITWKEKFIQVQHPRLEWINKVKNSFNQSLRNWNNNRYPAFYLFNDEEVVPIAKKYAENLEKILTNQVPIDDEATTKAFVSVSEWIKAYKNYQTDMDQLIEERISLQYNLSLLKKLKLDEDPRDIQLTVKRAGELKSEIITLRKEDKNLPFVIKKLKSEMLELDGTLLKNGKIKDRIIRQAMLNDMLTILQREVEQVSKNSPANEALSAELYSLNDLIKKADFSPVTYGVYKIQNKIFIRELMAATKLDVVYNKFKEPLLKLKTIVSDFFNNRKAGTDEQKVGIFKKMYTKITSITPRQAAIGGGTVAVAGLGYQRYFWFKAKSSTEQSGDQTTAVEIGPEDQAHQQQLENTKIVETEKHEGHSQAIEVHIDELTK